MNLNKKYKPIISKLLLVVPFSVVMSLAGMASGYGFVQGWLLVWLKNLALMMPIGYICAMIFLPISQKIIANIQWH
jgi:F0F1-type ATP synthase assembly protein I